MSQLFLILFIAICFTGCVYYMFLAPIPRKRSARKQAPPVLDDYANMPEPGSPEWEPWIDARIKRQDGVRDIGNQEYCDGRP